MSNDWRQVFKTFVRGNPDGDGKKPIEKVKHRRHIHNWEEVEDEDCFGGVLKDDFIDVSFDSKDMYERVMDMAEANDWKCLCLPSAHGGHTYWLKPQHTVTASTHDRKTAVGLTCDIHSGATYIPLRVHGTDRFPPDYDIEDGEEYQPLPEELWPVKTSIDLWGMDEGDGRNDELYKYILVLQKLRIDNDTIRRILRNANEFIFKTPLGSSEMDTILRDESFEQACFYNENHAFLHAEFAQYMADTQHVGMIDSQMYIYRNGVYMPGTHPVEQQMIEVQPGLKASQRTEAIKYMQLIAPELRRSDPRYIAFQNGIYDIVGRKIIPFDPGIVVTNLINVIYDPEAYCELADRALDEWSCGDRNIRALLEEIAGYILYRENIMRKAFMLTGGKRNGKSTYLDWLLHTLGTENVCALDLKELADRFSTAMMYGKLANIGDDIGDDFLQGSQVATFKKIVAGNRIKAEQKGQDPFEFNPYVKLLFSANDIPRIKDRTGAVLDRLIIVPFNAEFPKGDPYLQMRLRETDAKMYLVRLAVEGLHRVLEQGGFTISGEVQKSIEQYRYDNNPILGFIDEYGPKSGQDEIVNQTTKRTFDLYCIYCQQNHFTPLGSSQFGRQLKEVAGYTSKQRRVDGVTVRVYVKGD